MSELTEHEMLDRLKSTLRQAAERCRRLGIHPMRGFIYDAMRKDLKQIETDCTAMAFYRGSDARWLSIGQMMEEAHRRAGDWLRQHQTAAARALTIPKFNKLAENLDFLLTTIIKLETSATGTVGPILPAVLPAPHRPGRNVQVALPANMGRRPSGLIVPSPIIH